MCYITGTRLTNTNTGWAVFWPGVQSARDNHALACNFAKYSPILIFFTQTQQ